MIKIKNFLWQTVGKIVYFLLLPVLIMKLKNRLTTRAFIVKDNKVLVVKGWLSSGKYGLPGGGVKSLELPQQALLREVLEETNVKLKKTELDFHGLFKAKNGLVQYSYYLWSVQLDRPVKIKKQFFEIVDVKWLDVNVLNNNQVMVEVLKGLEIWQKKGNLL